MFAEIHKHAENLLWSARMDALPLPLRALVRIGRYAAALFRDAMEGQLTLRAMSLVYSTLLSLVPLIALSFSVLKGFGAHKELETKLTEWAQQFGPKGEELTSKLFGLVENVRVDVLGSLGLVFLLYVVISLVQKTEDGFNFIWRVRPSTNFATRMGAYISVILIGPVLMFTAIAIMASIGNNELVQRVMEIEPFGTTLVVAGKLVPYVLVIGTFTLVYVFIPNTRVRLKSALIGATVAGVLWSVTTYLFSVFAQVTTNYDRIYGGFAVLVLFMILIYLNWMILLMGAQISFYHQNPRFLRAGRAPIYLNNRLREEIALLVMYLVGSDFSKGQHRWTADNLAARIALPGDAIWYVINALLEAGLLVQTGNDDLIPGRDLQTIRLADVVGAVRGDAEEDAHRVQLSAAPVEQLIGTIDDSIRNALGTRTLHEFVKSPTEETGPS